MESPLSANPLVVWLRRAQARHSYWLTRFLILRLLGLVYFAAFVSLAVQVLPLLGSHGLLPAQDYLVGVQRHLGSWIEGLLALPSLFWFGISDGALTTLAWAGAALSLVVMLGYANVPIMAVLWLLYSSFVNIGQEWYAYGWEIQLLEIGFLAMFLCPLLDGRPFPKRPPPVLILWLFRWLSFRIMLGAGLIKWHGDSCWRDLTCLDFHYETQPIPNPLSRWFHFHPPWLHRVETAWNHVVELGVPWFAFGPRPVRHVAGVLFVSFQVFLIFSGNLSFLNWLTIVPMLACFDDSLLAKVLPKALVARARRAAENNPPTPPQEVLSVVYAVIVALLSIAPMLNLISDHQVMNDSFDRLHLVNTYGAFGVVGRERREIIFEGTTDETPDDHTVWRAYEFPFKPGDPTRTPGVIAPFQPRLDWAIWFAAMSTPNNYPWTLHFVWKLLQNDAGTLSLLANNPFPGEPPRYIRAQLYRYRFAQPGNPAGRYWERELLGPWLPPLSASDPVWQDVRRVYGWAR
ncbi:MAG TPA: lipase maturation factor family protein [Chthoniobacteraceae bacterium]|jgi:hypothetical protein|nr:lipase maturation factor family protein [Chthoniobacteraceae bacterium]